MDELSELYGVKIFYQDDIQLDRNFSFGYEDKSLNEVLDRLLSETTLGFVDYRGYGKVIAPKVMIDVNYSSDYYKALEGNQNEDQQRNRIDVIGDITLLASNGQATLTGTVYDVQTGEPVIGAAVIVPELDNGTATDLDGRYSLVVPAGRHQIEVSFIGYANSYQEVDVRSDGEYDINLDKSAIELQEVTVSAEAADAAVGNVQIGVTSIDIQEIEKLPSFLGEADVVKTFLLQPGVSSIGEGASGFNVRGGDVDQNLILQDEGYLFNSSHALGFFSSFNSDLIRKVDLYKGNIPAQYGGRLASVMNVEMRDGNFEQFKINGGVGPVSSRLSLEGPIVKDKISFLGAFRSSYTDWVINLVKDIEVKRSSAFFYDANARLTIKPNEKHTFTLSGYSSQDDFTYNEEFGFDYSTFLAEFSYRTILTDQIFSKLSVTKSTYESTQFDFLGIDASQLDNTIDYIRAKENIRIVPNDRVEFNTGVSAILYELSPSDVSPFGENSTVIPKTLEEEKGLEAAAFGNVEFDVSDNFLISAGIRYTYYQFRGPKTVFEYEDPSNPTSETITGSALQTGTIASYNSLEPRLSMRYRLGETASIKAGYSRTSQFISQIFNSDSPTPTSQWQLSTNYIKPLMAHNMSIGYFNNFDDNNWESSIELYTRLIDQLFDFRDFADLIANEHIETELLSGEGRAYGLELSLKKKVGVLNGFLSYTYSKSERRIEGINNGEYYPSSFDKTHDISFVFNYNPNRRNTFTVNFNYGTGRPTTPPIGNYATDRGLVIPIFANRNSLRIPDYLRMDLAYTIGEGYKRNKKFRTSWTISLYNVLGRRNAFSVFFTQGPFNQPQANKLAVLGTIFPSLTLNFELL